MLGIDNLLPLLVLAIGGAMVVGNVMALVRPPASKKPGDLDQAPRGRSMGMAAVGFVAAAWALGSLIKG